MERAGYLLNVTSGTWLSPADSNMYTWYHQVIVCIPDVIADNTHASIYITGGDDGDSPPDSLDEDVLAASVMALATGTVAVTIRQIPNQPIIFADDPSHQHRSEDAAVAWTWLHMINNPSEPEWILYFPMTRAVLRAMDAVEQFAPHQNSKLDLQKWFVYGASKRGWITWLVGAVDNERVVAIAPMVMDLLNFKPNLEHMYENFGAWTFAFADYCAVNITHYLPTSLIDPLAARIDPLGYKANLTMPKLVVDACGDEFFQLDDDYFWWGDLLGETYRAMIPDAEHSLATGLPFFAESATGFWKSIIMGSKRPQVSWVMENVTGTIELVTDTKPTSVKLWFATTIQDVRRDFRLVVASDNGTCPQGIPVDLFGHNCLVPVIWVDEEIGPSSVDADGYHYTLTQPLPPTGWRGFLADLTYPGPTEDLVFRFTSQASLIPQTRPFGPCPVGCPCTLC